ncbi:putative ABC transporter B family member 21 [Iris pallida]|uniref:ABC transporter B family member 21 n=1 Tax=Iris pallida TaxID=29817 RepID=A0AAX6DIX2_IRIPA|nr:putative ABC transporter B family member 21 [Iris pallida]
MSGDTVLIQDAMGEKVGKFIQLMATFVVGFIVAFARGWLLTLVMLSVIPPLVIAGAAMATIIAKLASRGQTAYAEAAVVVEQTIGSIRTVASFTGEKQSVDKYSKSLKSAYDSSVHEGLATGLGLGSVMFLMFCGYSLGIWYGSKLILDKGYTGADVINVIFAVVTGSFSLGQASPSLTAFAAGQAAAFKMFETINRKPEIDASDLTGTKLDDIRGDIEFRDVYFSYPARPDEQIFRGFSLSIQSGRTVALVGESGSGKSTVISLIERFYDPHAGEVLVDGINLKEFQLRWIRGKIGLVSQEPVLFASSIRDNIAYGKDGATAEEIRVAAELANASRFIDKMPQGFDTMVGEHGTKLSGGQKQRVAIARAILKDPRILLLDEATSALDAESERVVQEALDRIMTNRTTVVVAHRLTTVRNADTIAVIQRGSIIEKGSHSELLENPDGAYCQLIRLQEMNPNSHKGSKHEHMNKPNLSSSEGKRNSSRQMSFHPFRKPVVVRQQPSLLFRILRSAHRRRRPTDRRVRGTGRHRGSSEAAEGSIPQAPRLPQQTGGSGPRARFSRRRPQRAHIPHIRDPPVPGDQLVLQAPVEAEEGHQALVAAVRCLRSGVAGGLSG